MNDYLISAFERAQSPAIKTYVVKVVFRNTVVARAASSCSAAEGDRVGVPRAPSALGGTFMAPPAAPARDWQIKPERLSSAEHTGEGGGQQEEGGCMRPDREGRGFFGEEDVCCLVGSVQ